MVFPFIGSIKILKEHRMKKRLIYCGCATVKPKREVVDNTLSSTSPKLRVKVDSSFTYLGDLRYGTWTYDVSEYRKKQQTQEVHAFVFVTAEGTMIKKALMIKIHKMKKDRHFTADQLAHKKNILDRGNLRLAGKRFQYYSKAITITMGDPVAEYIYNKGYTTPDHVLMTRIMRVRDLGKTLIKFDYYEDISDSGFGDYNSWRNKDDLYEEQWNILDVCKKNCLTAFEILK
jgi:hypothetical protein